MLKIRKSGDGKYFLDYTFGPKGKKCRQRLYGFNSRSEAEHFKSELALRPLDQILDFQKLIEMSLDEAIEKYLTTVSFRKASYKTEKDYFDKMKIFFSGKNKFDGKVWSVGLMEVQELQIWLQNYEYTRAKDKNSKKAIKRFISASTVNRHFHTYRNFFELCRQWNLIRKNPCEFLKDLETEEKRRAVWTPEQCAHVLSTLPDWAVRVLICIAATAARRAEVCKLLPEKVDLDRGVVILRSRKGKGKIVDREAPMTEGFYRFMSEQLQMAKKNKWPYVFCNHQGEEISMTYLTNLVTRKAKKLGYKGLTIHGLRHTLLSMLANSGTNLDQVRKLAGHTNLRTTQGYLHNNVDHIRNSLTKLEITSNLQEILSAKGHKSGGHK